MKLESLGLKREKTRLEIRKLKLELDRMEKQAKEDLDERGRGADRILRTVVDRLNSNPIKLEDVGFEFDGHDDK